MAIIVVTEEKCAINTEYIISCAMTGDNLVIKMNRGAEGTYSFVLSGKSNIDEFLNKLDMLFYRNGEQP